MMNYMGTIDEVWSRSFRYGVLLIKCVYAVLLDSASD
jgi:hypothetical protein